MFSQSIPSRNRHSSFFNLSRPFRFFEVQQRSVRKIGRRFCRRGIADGRRHDGTKARLHDYTRERLHEGTMARRHDYTITRWHEGTITRLHDGTKARLHEGTTERLHCHTVHLSGLLLMLISIARICSYLS